MTTIEVRDILRVADSQLSINIWTSVKDGSIKFTNEQVNESYNPDERIEYYTERLNKYLKRVKNHVETEGGPSVRIIISFIETGLTYLPKEFKDKLIALFRKFLLGV